MCEVVLEKYLITHLTKRSPRGEIYEQEAVAQESVISHMVKVRSIITKACKFAQFIRLKAQNKNKN